MPPMGHVCTACLFVNQLHIMCVHQTRQGGLLTPFFPLLTLDLLQVFSAWSAARSDSTPVGKYVSKGIDGGITPGLGWAVVWQ